MKKKAKSPYSNAERKVCAEVAVELDRILNRVERIGLGQLLSKDEELHALLRRLRVIAQMEESK